MKKIYALLSIMLFTSGLIAQEIIVFADFEDGTTQGFNPNTASVVDNPDKDEVNDSEKVLFFANFDNLFAGPNKWSGEGDHFIPEYTSIKIDVYVEELSHDPWDESVEDDVVAMRVWGQGSLSEVANWFTPTEYIYETNKWVTLEFDLSDIPAYDYQNLFIQAHIGAMLTDNYRWVIEEPTGTREIPFSFTDIRVFSQPGHIILANAEGKTARVYSVIGSHVYTGHVHTNRFELSMPRGVYVVVVGDSQAQKVIVQ